MPTSFRVGAGPCLGIGRCSYVEAPEDRISAEVKVVNRKHELTSHPCRAPTRDSYCDDPGGRRAVAVTGLTLGSTGLLPARRSVGPRPWPRDAVRSRPGPDPYDHRPGA